MSLLSAHQLCKHFGGLKAIDEVDFELQPGEIRAVIGPNGAGKTTLVSLLCGRLDPTSGRIRFQQQDITALPAYRRVRRGIAYTFQITSIYPNLSVYDNVAIAAQNALDRHERPLPARVDAILQRVGIAALAGDVAGVLAYGHQRLLEIAMGLALSPRLLILDEPTQGLSDDEIAHFCSLVRALNQQAAVLLIEHNMQVVMSLAQRITVLDRGRVLAEGSPAEMQRHAGVQAAYLGAGA